MISRTNGNLLSPGRGRSWRRRLISALGDRGVDIKLMKLAGDELRAGHGAVFVMAEDAKADEIATKFRRLSNLKQYDGQILRAQCVRASNRLGFGAALMTAL